MSDEMPSTSFQLPTPIPLERIRTPSPAIECSVSHPNPEKKKRLCAKQRSRRAKQRHTNEAALAMAGVYNPPPPPPKKKSSKNSREKMRMRLEIDGLKAQVKQLEETVETMGKYSSVKERPIGNFVPDMRTKVKLTQAPHLIDLSDSMETLRQEQPLFDFNLKRDKKVNGGIADNYTTIRENVKLVETRPEHDDPNLSGQEIVSAVKGKGFKFNPLSEGGILDINKSLLQLVQVQPIPLSKPNKLISIEKDGNCFYRCVSVVITGEEGSHAGLRQLLCKYMMSNCQESLKAHLKKEIKTLAEHMLKGKVSENYTWATDVEIIAMAGMLRTDIYVFKGPDGPWEAFRAELCAAPANNMGIYLQLKDDHYEVVVGVEP